VLTSLQVFLRLAVLQRLGVFICALAMLLSASNTASALEPAQTKTRVWGLGFAADNFAGLFRAVSLGKHHGNRIAGTEAASDSLLAARGAGDAFKIAQAGGKHAGFLKNYAGRSAAEIQRGITSIEKQIAEHQAKIANPEKFIEGWSKLDPRQQQALVNNKWPSDIQRQSEQLEILRGLLGGG
jgi:hypothetical protein